MQTILQVQLCCRTNNGLSEGRLQPGLCTINPAVLGVSALWHLVSLFRCLDDSGANYSLVPSGRVHVLLFLGWSTAGLFILLHPIPSFALENPSVLISEQGLGHKHCSDVSCLTVERAQYWLSCPTTLNPSLVSTYLLMVIESSLFSLLFMQMFIESLL